MNHHLTNRNLIFGVTHMSRINQVKNLMTELEGDLDKFYNKSNKAAGTRARKSLQDLKKLAQEIRLEIQDMKNNG
jgi:hypothetical protein